LRVVPITAAILVTSAASAYAATPVSWITDARVTESSALAISIANSTIAYTVNDDEPGDAAVVYAVRISSGKVVGATTLNGVTAFDPEALAIDSGGYLWIADTGVDGGRSSNWAGKPPTLYRFKEQGAGNHAVSATRYPLKYSNGKHENVETLLIRPKDNRKFLITKGVAANSGRRFSLPTTLKANQPNTATLRQSNVADSVSDGSFTPNSKWAVVRKAKTKVYVYDARTSPWKVHYTWDPLPSSALRKPESLGFRKDGTKFLVGSEGAGYYPGGKSPLYWVSFNQSTGKPS
jgi:hypothetical protein